MLVAKQHRHPMGITLIESLAAIGIIGMLLAILIPAMQESIRSARHAQCRSNLRQISLGVLLHESSHRTFPTGGWGNNWIGLSDRGFGVSQPGAWIFNTLPFLEYGQTREIAPSCANPDTSNYSKFANTVLPFVLCPERGGNPIVPASSRFHPPCAGISRTYSRSDYAMNAGNRNCRIWNGPSSLVQGDTLPFLWHDTMACTGVSFPRSTVRSKDIRDGCAHVIMCGEKWANLVVESDQGANQSLFSGDCLDVRRETVLPPRQDNVEGYPVEFGSAHVTHLNFTFCDGSARALSYEIDRSLFYYLGGRSDGNEE